MKVYMALVLAMVITTLPAGNSSAEINIPTLVKDEAPLFAVLLGGNEGSDEGSSNVGDPDGRGSATVIIDANRGTICFAITVSGIATPAAAHIHRAPSGTNGDIVIGLTAPTTGNPGASCGCITGVTPGLLKSIKNTPSAFYVNVHTSDFPAGAVRGQLF